MSKERDLQGIIYEMHMRLNEIVEKNDFDLLCDEVLSYSKQLDKVIAIYLRYISLSTRNSNNEGLLK